MQELEKVLNSLIQRGWKPGDFSGESEIKISEYQGVVIYMKTEDAVLGVKTKLRNLVSIESGFWQFVCDEQLCKLPEYIDAQWCKTVEDDIENEKDVTHILTEYDYKYRLLESALIPEKELGKFLIDNIVIEWNSK